MTEQGRCQRQGSLGRKLCPVAGMTEAILDAAAPVEETPGCLGGSLQS